MIVVRVTRDGAGRLATQTMAPARRLLASEAMASAAATCQRESLRGVTPAVASGVSASASLMSSRATAMSGSRYPLLFCQTPSKQAPNRVRRIGGQRSPVGIALDHDSDVSATSSGPNAAPPVNIS